jgi:hypothetical protein
MRFFLDLVMISLLLRQWFNFSIFAHFCVLDRVMIEPTRAVSIIRRGLCVESNDDEESYRPFDISIDRRSQDADFALSDGVKLTRLET